ALAHFDGVAKELTSPYLLEHPHRARDCELDGFGGFERGAGLSVEHVRVVVLTSRRPAGALGFDACHEGVEVERQCFSHVGLLARILILEQPKRALGASQRGEPHKKTPRSRFWMRQLRGVLGPRVLGLTWGEQLVAVYKRGGRWSVKHLRVLWVLE